MWRSAGGQALLIFLPLAAITGAIVAAVYWNQQRTEQRLLELDERSQVDLLARLVVSDFRSAASDLMFLSEGPAVKKLVAVDSPEAGVRTDVEEEFRQFSIHKQVYDQIRYIDREGNEVVRVNLVRGAAQVVPRDKLQTKLDRYYFTAAIQLDRGEMFLSPFDLNVEEGRIETPFKPTIRFATVVFDERGQKRGIVVLNYLGERLLSRLVDTSAGSAGRPMLVDSGGYWLKGLTREDEWGFMFPERQDATMAKRYPSAWREIAGSEDGAIQTEDGLFTFATARHARAAPDAAPAATSPRTGPHEWKIVSFVASDVLATRRSASARQTAILSIALAAIMATVSWLLASANVRHRAAQDQAREAERLAAIGEAMTALAHESRNALQRSQAGLEMLARRVVDRPEAAELLQEVQQAQYHLHELYEQVRDYAAPVNLRRSEVNVADLVSQIWAQLSPARRDRPLSLVVENTPVAPTVQADAGRIGQVLRNILENAIAASPDAGKIVARIEDASLHGRPALRVSIQDHGAGLSEEARRRLFDPFFTTKQRGTGLGMTIARRFVEAHNGTIDAATNNGTTIVVTLPRA